MYLVILYSRLMAHTKGRWFGVTFRRGQEGLVVLVDMMWVESIPSERHGEIGGLRALEILGCC